MPRLFVNNLCAIDSSVLLPEVGLTGKSWQVDVELLGELNQQSMVFDFSLVKKIIKRIIDEQVDHKLIVAKHCKNLSIHSVAEKQQTRLEFTTLNGDTLSHQSPDSALCLINSETLCDKSLENHITNIVLSQLPDNVDQLTIRLNPEPTNGHYYQYSHGLKKHAGNCQRIAHGHRSRIEVKINNQRDNNIEQAIAEKWNHIYLATIGDISHQDNRHIQLEYQAPQGTFKLKLASKKVHAFEQDSTVECIAEHIVYLLTSSDYFGKQFNNQTVEVRAFEGIGKGSIASND